MLAIVGMELDWDADETKELILELFDDDKVDDWTVDTDLL